MSIWQGAGLTVILLVLFILLCPLYYRLEFSRDKIKVVVRIYGFLRFQWEFPDEETEVQLPQENEDSRISIEEIPEKNGSQVETRHKTDADKEAAGPDKTADPAETAGVSVSDDRPEEDPFTEDIAEERESSFSRLKTQGQEWFALLKLSISTGFLKRTLMMAKRILYVSRPGKVRIEGEWGSGDPMMTGIVEGMIHAILPERVIGISFCYIDEVNTIHGKARGFIVPFAVLWIVGNWYFSNETRIFMRERGKLNG